MTVKDELVRTEQEAAVVCRSLLF